MCFVIPTFDEADNITPLLAQVLETVDKHGRWDLNVLVVDDESPDGTATRVRAFSKVDPRVSLLSGVRRGLGDAYLRGFEHAMRDIAPDVLVQMDADFSHAPSDCVRLLEALDEETDLVIGSRYVAGGRIDANWGLSRRLLSRAGNFLARYVARLYSVRDCTSGFKAVRMAVLEEVRPLRFRLQGYVFQVALLHSLVVAGARVREIPISFRE
ncbi:MAG: polyprenol monophosphomannose synthase [Gammaproteobacteria bacterium]|nr:polyprenol monophosphomannose synthase [Gammaproteobacteria bacterium]